MILFRKPGPAFRDHALLPAPCSRLRDGDSEILAESLARMLAAEQVTALQLRHDETDEVLVGSWNVGRGDDEAVAGALEEPLLEPVRHFLRAADDRVMHAAAAAEMDEIAHRRILFSAGAHDAVADALETGDFRHLGVGERLVHALPREVEVERL